MVILQLIADDFVKESYPNEAYWFGKIPEDQDPEEDYITVYGYRLDAFDVIGVV